MVTMSPALKVLKEKLDFQEPLEKQDSPTQSTLQKVGLSEDLGETGQKVMETKVIPVLVAYLDFLDFKGQKGFLVVEDLKAILVIRE